MTEKTLTPHRPNRAREPVPTTAVMLYSLWHVGISPRPPRRRRSPGQLRRPNGPPLNGQSRGGLGSVHRVGAASFNAGPLRQAADPARSGAAVVPVLAPGLVD